MSIDPHCRLCNLVTAELDDSGMCQDIATCAKLACADIVEDLVDLAGMMAITGQNKSTVSMWATRAASNGFPDPLLVLPSTRLWSRREVAAWYVARKYPA